FAPGYSGQNGIRVLGGHGHGQQLQDALANPMSSPHFPVGLDHMRGLELVEELAEGETELGNFRIRTIQLNHPGGCVGFRIESDSGTLAYFPDHEPYRIENDELAARAH